jgi:shikimate dehydrogenase
MNNAWPARILGIYGDPISHSLSPLLLNDALSRAGIDAVYLPFRITGKDLPQAVAAIRVLGLWGMTITTPHKEAVVPLLDEVDADARLIGAVNCIENRDGRLKGYNTDCLGFSRTLRELNFIPKGRRAMLIGAGGAARAAIVGLARAGVAVIDLFNRTPQRAEQVAAELGPNFPNTRINVHGLNHVSMDALAADADLISNTSTIGFKGESFAYFPWEHVSSGTTFCDWVYSRGGTPWLNHARRAGYCCADGLDVLVGQAKEAFCLWTGRAIPEGAFDLATLRADYGNE